MKDDILWLLEKEHMVVPETALKQQKKVSSVGAENRYLKEVTPETGITCRMHCSHVPGIPTGKEPERDRVGLREKQVCDVAWPEALAHPAGSSEAGVSFQGFPRRSMWPRPLGLHVNQSLEASPKKRT